MNLNKEERNGYVISEDMKKIWNIQLLCVKKVLDEVLIEDNMVISIVESK